MLTVYEVWLLRIFHVTGIVTLPFYGETDLDVKEFEKVKNRKSGSLGLALAILIVWR